MEAEQAALGSSLISAEILGITQVFFHYTNNTNAITSKKYSNEIKILTSGNLAEAGEEGDLAALRLILIVIVIVLLELLLHHRSPGLFTHITKLTLQL